MGGPFPSTTTERLQTLRGDIYDFLEDVGRIAKEPGQYAPVHLAPLKLTQEGMEEELDQRTIQVNSSGAGFGEAEANRLVELAAMRTAVQHYTGWDRR